MTILLRKIKSVSYVLRRSVTAREKHEFPDYGTHVSPATHISPAALTHLLCVLLAKAFFSKAQCLVCATIHCSLIAQASGLNTSALAYR